MSIITGSDIGSFSSENIGVEIHHQQKQELLKNLHGSNSLSSTLTVSNGSPIQVQLQQSQVPAKRKRNLPGNPDPSAEVIALSPKTLLATNRFVCEICKKGFQRDQNLQLHRRGHNLPWKLKQRSSDEIRKKVYICPEPSCVHNNPARALGDLTGIKKHFFRKHGEKKWKCDRCSKKYAVQSDWKAHSKICGTREYKCDCGTLFSRRDSFITHRAFCDAIADHEQTNKANQQIMSNMIPNLHSQLDQLVSEELITPLPVNINENLNQSGTTSEMLTNQSTDIKIPIITTLPQDHQLLVSTIPSKPMNNNMIGSIFSTNLNMTNNNISQPQVFENSLQSFGGSSSNYSTSGGAHLSATALLQKAAQMGASVSGNNMNSNFITSMACSTTNGISNQLMNKSDSKEIMSSRLFMNGNGNSNFGMFSDAGMFSGINNTALLKSMEQNNNIGNKNGNMIGIGNENGNMIGIGNENGSGNGNGNESWSEIGNGNVNKNVIRNDIGNGNGTDVTTVDFLGIGRSSARVGNFQEQQKQLHEHLQQKQVEEMGFGIIGNSIPGSIQSSNQINQHHAGMAPKQYLWP